MKTSRLTQFIRTPHSASKADSLELPPVLWEIFTLAETPITPSAIAKRFEVPLDEAVCTLEELTSHGLLAVHLQSWGEFKKALLPPTLPLTIPVPAPQLALALETQRIELLATVTPPVAKPPASGPIRFKLSNAAAAAARADVLHESVFFTIRAATLRPPTTQRTSTATQRTVATQTPSNGWRLRPLLDQIINHGGGGITGQLLAYRVFLRVPSELLARSGLHSLNMADTSFSIHDAELYSSILSSVHDVTGIDLHEDALAC